MLRTAEQRLPARTTAKRGDVFICVKHHLADEAYQQCILVFPEDYKAEADRFANLMASPAGQVPEPRAFDDARKGVFQKLIIFAALYHVRPGRALSG